MFVPKKSIPVLLLLLAFGVEASARAEEDATKVLDLNQVDMEQVDDDWDNQSQVPKVRADSGLRIKDIVEPTSEYTYASFGKADPFSVPMSFAPKTLGGTASTEIGPDGEVIPAASAESKEITVNSPLQAYPLNLLEVKGVWQTQEGEFRAIIQTPKKEGVIVKDGDPISSGKILTIAKEEIKVRLYKLGVDGVREFTDTEMTFGQGTKLTKATVRLEPGKEAQFPSSEEPADGDDPAATNGGGAAQVDLGNAINPPPADSAKPAAVVPKAAPAVPVAVPAAAPVAVPPTPAPKSGRPGAVN